MKSNNQKKNLENWYTQNGEHYVCSFGEEYEQHFTETKNTDGGCAILTNQYCYFQGKYLLKPKKKAESCLIDEKIPLNKMVKCGFKYLSPLKIILICILLVGVGVSIWNVNHRSESIQRYYEWIEAVESRLESENPLGVYKSKISEYNQIVEAFLNAFTENGGKGSYVYNLEKDEYPSDVSMEVDNDIKVIVQYLRADNYQLIATNYYIMTNFGEKHWEYITSYESSREEGVWGDVLNRAVEYQRQYDKFFSDPEAFEQMVSCLEKLYANYLDEYLDDLFGYEHEEEIGYGDSFIRTRYAAGYLEGFEEIEEEITSYEEGFQDRIEELTRYISWDKEERSVWIAAIIILLLLLFVLFKPRFFYIIYRTDTLDDKTLYLFLKKGFYRETKAFSSKFKIAQNMKEKAVYATEKPVSKLSETPAANSQPDDLRKYAELLKDGVITQEEFDAMKQKILEL